MIETGACEWSLVHTLAAYHTHIDTQAGA